MHCGWQSLVHENEHRRFHKNSFPGTFFPRAFMPHTVFSSPVKMGDRARPPSLATQRDNLQLGPDSYMKQKQTRLVTAPLSAEEVQQSQQEDRKMQERHHFQMFLEHLKKLLRDTKFAEGQPAGASKEDLPPGRDFEIAKSNP